jgi:Domain of unknown function (DUF4352)
MDLNSRKFTHCTATISLLALIAGCSAPNLTPGASPSKDVASPASNTPKKTESKSLPKTTYRLGETVPIREKNLDLTFTVNGTREHTGKRVLKPNKGDKWILVDTTIVNQGQKPKLLPVVAFQLVDSTNKVYEVALLAGALEDVKSPTGNINPGAIQRGEVAFEVPEKVKGLKLVFNPNSNECNAASASKSKSSSTLKCEPVVVKLDQ